METITGEIIEIFDEKQITERFKKRELAVKVTSEKYTEEILLQTVNGFCDTLDTYNVGDQVKITFRVGGRKVKDKYYNSLTVTSINFNL